MVECRLHLDSVFHSLADPTRRDILQRVAGRELTVSELVARYNVSFAAISKHLKVLEQAKLIRKRKEGRKYMVALEPDALKQANIYLEQYRQMWDQRFNKLDTLLQDK